MLAVSILTAFEIDIAHIPNNIPNNTNDTYITLIFLVGLINDKNEQFTKKE